MINFFADKNKCLNCGKCVNDCLHEAIKLGNDGFPYMDKEEECLKCQHCFAICNQGAITILNKNPNNSDKILEHNPNLLLNLIKSRRSIREYKQENISKEHLDKLKNMLNYSPTGCNYRGLHFAIIDDIKVMNKFRDKINKKMIETLEHPTSNFTKKYIHYAEEIKAGKDIIFRTAPHMIAVCTDKNSPCFNIDPIIALSYFELYAQSLGIGTCWCGIAYDVLTLFKEFQEDLNMPDGYEYSYAMLFGYPNIKYKRTIQPDKYSFHTLK